MMFDLTNQHAIVSGGAGAIGLCMSKALHEAGASVTVWSRSQESIQSLPAEYGGLQVDAGDEAQVAQALEHSIELSGPPNILINAVGGNIGKGPFVDTDIEAFKRILDMNLIAGLMVPTKVVSSYWIKEKIEGCIINLTSMASYVPLSGVWAYNAAKAAVLNLTQATAKEFAPHRIRVNAIAPGFFIGKQNRDLLIDKETGELTERGQSVVAHTPFKRFGKVEELCGATIFLSSSKASGFVTGVSIPVDGGYLIDNI